MATPVNPADVADRYSKTYPRLLTDVYVAAFALSADMPQVTFDQDFKRFSGWSLRLLDPKDVRADRTLTLNPAVTALR